MTDLLGLAALITAGAGGIAAIAGVWSNASKIGELREDHDELKRQHESCTGELELLQRKYNHQRDHIRYVDGLLTLLIPEHTLSALHERIVNLRGARPDWARDEGESG